MVYSDGHRQSFTDLYAEGFDEDTLQVQSFKFDDSTGNSSAAVMDNAIVLSPSSDGTGYANRSIRSNESAESVALRATIDEQTSLPVGADSAAFVFLNAALFNTLTDHVVEGEEPTVGNVSMFYRVGIFGSGESLTLVYLDRQGVAGNKPCEIFPEGANCWMAPNSAALVKGQAFSFRYELDVAA